MNLFQKLFGGASDTSTDVKVPESVRVIAKRVEGLDTSKARYVACFAYILGRAAHADAEVSAVEMERMRQIVGSLSELSAAEAELIVDLAKNRAQLYGHTEDFVVAREFTKLATTQQRQELLHCAFAVVAADDSISSTEESIVRQISKELDVSDPDYLAIRAAYNEKRDVLKNLPSSEKG